MIIQKSPDQLIQEEIQRQALEVRLVELERADASRKALEEAVRRIEGLKGNVMYQRAYRVAIAAVRSVARAS